MRVTRQVAVLCHTLAIVALLAGSVCAVDVAMLVPADAVLYAGSDDVAELAAAWNDTGMGRLLQQPELTEFVDSWRTARRLSPKCSVPRLGLSWQQLQEVAAGQVCLALLPVAEHETGYALLIDTTGQDSQVAAVLAELQEQYAADATITHETRTIADVTVEVYRIPIGEEKTTTLERYYFHREGLLGVTDRAELVDKLVAMQDAPEDEHLANSPSFRTILEQCRESSSSPHANWYFHPWRYAQLTRSAGQDSKVSTLARLKDQGFAIVHGIGGCITYATEEHDLVHRWLIHATGNREQTARLLDFQTIEDAEVPAWVPADADSVRAVQWQLASALEGYGWWFDSVFVEDIVGTFAESLDDLRDDKYGPQVDVRKLLVLQDGPLWEITKATGNDEQRVTNWMYAVKLRDAQWVAKEVDRLFNKEEADRITVDAHTLLVLKPDPNFPGPDMAGTTIGVIDGYLFVANSLASMEHVLAADTKRLADSKNFNALQPALKNQLQEQTIGWRLVLAAGGLGPMYKDWRHRGNDILAGILSGGTKDIAFAKLPPVEFAQKFLPIGYELTEESEAGWLFTRYRNKLPAPVAETQQATAAR